MNSIGTSSFFGFEGIRILVPGALLYGLCQALLVALGEAAPLEPVKDVGVGLFATLVLGLVFHSLDFPGYSPIVRRVSPARHLGTKQIRGLEGMKAENLYFILFDSELPSDLRQRSVYYSAMFRIGFECILSIGIVQAAYWASVHTFGLQASWPSVGLAALLALTLLVVAGINGRHGGIRDLRRPHSVLLLVLLAAVIIARCAPIPDLVSNSVTALAIAGAVVHWVVRLNRGVPIAEAEQRDASKTAQERVPGEDVAAATSGDNQYSERRELSPFANLTHFFWAQLLGLVASANFAASTSFDSEAGHVIWVMLAAAGGIQIVGREHEKRFLAANYQQQAWIDWNMSKVNDTIAGRSRSST